MRFKGCIIRGWTGSCASSRALATRSVLAAGRGGADGDSSGCRCLACCAASYQRRLRRFVYAYGVKGGNVLPMKLIKS